MSEIIPKERVLKSVRKGLVVPAVNPFLNLDVDTSVYNMSKLSDQEQIVSGFLSLPNAHFQACNNKFEFLLLFKKLMDAKGWKDPVCHTNALTDLFEDNGIPIQVNIPGTNNPFISTCNKLLSKPSLLVFDLRYHYMRKILAAPILVIVATESQLSSYQSDKKFFELSPLEVQTRCAINPAKLENKEVYLFLINDVL
jgi:hypothetical protein